MPRRYETKQAAAVRTTVAVLAAAMTLVGCSDGRPARYPVAGTVRFASGVLVRNASIEFVPSAPGPSPRGRIDRDGRFTLSTYDPGDGAPAGEYRVIVVQALPPNAAVAARKLGEEHAAHAGQTPMIAVKHASPTTTGVTCTVEPIAANEVEIVVEAE